MQVECTIEASELHGIDEAKSNMCIGLYLRSLHGCRNSHLISYHTMKWGDTLRGGFAPISQMHIQRVRGAELILEGKLDCMHCSMHEIIITDETGVPLPIRKKKKKKKKIGPSCYASYHTRNMAWQPISCRKRTCRTGTDIDRIRPNYNREPLGYIARLGYISPCCPCCPCCLGTTYTWGHYNTNLNAHNLWGGAVHFQPD